MLPGRNSNHDPAGGGRPCGLPLDLGSAVGLPRAGMIRITRIGDRIARSRRVPDHWRIVDWMRWPSRSGLRSGQALIRVVDRPPGARRLPWLRAREASVGIVADTAAAPDAKRWSNARQA